MATTDKPIWNTGLFNNGKLEQVYEMATVRHGHWEAVEYGDGTVRTECSVCGYGRGLPPVRNYCPNCGAKMDEERIEDGKID